MSTILDTAGQTPWIGVDLDGTLAFYDKWTAWNVIGPPIPAMLTRVQQWLSEGREVRIFTARCCFDEDTCYKTGAKFTRDDIIRVVQDWCENAGLPRLPVTYMKDFKMVELWDDRAVQVIPNTGRTLADELDAISMAHTGKAWTP